MSFCLLFLIFFLNESTFGCTNDSDCSLLGICNSTTKTCKCSSGFYGNHCNYMNLSTPISWNNGGYHNTSISTWDGWPVKDNNDKYKYHLFISIITNNCPLQGYWRTNSIIAHLVSINNNTIGPYKLNDISLYPNTNKSSFDSLSVYNPSIIKQNNLYLLYYTATTSTNNETHANCSNIKFNDNVLESLGNTQKIGLATSKSLYGPWTRSTSNPIIVPNRLNKYLWNSGFVCNPAPLLLNNGTIVIVYKAKPLDFGNQSKNTMYYGIATNLNSQSNNDINGPYLTLNHNKSFNLPTYCADPFLWSSYNDTKFNILFQCHWNCSQQIAFSTDLLNWNYFNDKFWCNVTLTNNTNINLLRRERPALIFNDNKQIDYLFTAVQPSNGRTFNTVQKIGISAEEYFQYEAQQNYAGL